MEVVCGGKEGGEVDRLWKKTEPGNLMWRDLHQLNPTT